MPILGSRAHENSVNFPSSSPFCTEVGSEVLGDVLLPRADVVLLPRRAVVAGIAVNLPPMGVVLEVSEETAVNFSIFKALKGAFAP